MNEKNKLALQSNRELIFIQKEDILYALADGNYTYICLTDNRQVKILKKLKQVAELLSPDNFIRIHRSHLVNMSHIMRFEKGTTLIMSDEKKLRVARTYKPKFIKLITKL